jgi:hypothetical protein
VASAIAMILLIVLVVPIVLVPERAGPRDGGRQMTARWSWFNIHLGGARLRLPLPADRVLLVVYSFNESRLVTVWAGFSTKWYGELFRTRASSTPPG